jgi:hypothetical protein
MPRRGYLYCWYKKNDPTITSGEVNSLSIIKIGKTMNLDVEMEQVYKNTDDKIMVFYVECGNIDNYLRLFNNAMKRLYQLKDPLNTRIYVANIDIVKKILCDIVRLKKCMIYKRVIHDQIQDI